MVKKGKEIETRKFWKTIFKSSEMGQTVFGKIEN